MKQPSPRLDALRAMRERNFDEASKKRKTSMSDVCREGRHEECQNITLYGWPPCQCKCHLKEKTVMAAAKSDAASKRRKAKKVKRNSRRGNPA